jgi:hypothetical protein
MIDVKMLLQPGRGSKLTPEEQTLRFASLTASLLNLIAIVCISMGLWRFGADMDLAGNFVIQTGLFSHWQIWIGAAVCVQYASWILKRSAREPSVAKRAWDICKDSAVFWQRRTTSRERMRSLRNSYQPTR